MINKKQNFLIKWRIFRNLSPEKVEELLNYPPGTIENFEIRGFSKVPVSELIKVLYLYKVPIKEIYKEIEKTKALKNSKK